MSGRRIAPDEGIDVVVAGDVRTGFDLDSTALHDELWRLAAGPRFARRRVYDARLALSLRRQGVTEFATANVKDFRSLGFDRVWNPVE